MLDADFQRLMKVANDAANLAARNYTGIDAEDIAANIMEAVCKSPDRYERHLEHGGWIWSVFYAEAIKYANKQIRDFMFYSAEHFYTPQEVRELLTRAYTTDVQEGEEIQITEATLSLIDLQIAFDKLGFHDKDLITRRYARNEVFGDADRKAFYRATVKVAGMLNRTIETGSQARRTHEGPGSRKAMTNAHAQAITASSLDSLRDRKWG